MVVGPAEVEAELAAILEPWLRPVINATGIVLHTNLGRAPLAEAAVSRLVEVARGYGNLELRLATGERGGRHDPVDQHVRALTGAERAFAVNNGAAAALLMLASAAAGREVIVSRGELVEIGGGFRIPEVLEQSGCRLVEVGTTNRTRITDYQRAITPNTGALLKVHPSNFAIVGFTGDVSLRQLGQLAREKGVPLLFDQGSGELAGVREAIAAGAYTVTFSGDKLLGGPQAGILAGKSEAIGRALSHPLARALRLDKLGTAALEATLALRRAGRAGELPVERMLSESAETVRERAEAMARGVGDACRRSVVSSEAAAGGGSRPGETVESFALRIETDAPDEFAAFLRRGRPAVLGRVEKGAVLLDARTVSDDEIDALISAICRAAERQAACRLQASVRDGMQGDGALERAGEGGSG